MSKKTEMRKFIERHSNFTFSASELAKELGWKREKTVTYQVKDEKGKAAGNESITKTSCNTNAARRLAKKCGAQITRTEEKSSSRGVIGQYNITFA